jgi:hypothetical protein
VANGGARRFPGRTYGFSYELFGALLVGGILVAAVVPALLFGERTPTPYGQIGLLPGDSVPAGWHRCTGTGRFVEIRQRAKLSITTGGSNTFVHIGEGHLQASGRCEFPFFFGAPTTSRDFRVRDQRRGPLVVDRSGPEPTPRAHG